MSDAKTVSPLLDEFSLGKPFSSHNGITCCPAIHTVTKEKFILKQISVPESQIQVDAMLLTGACADRAAAQTYYAEMAKGLEQEAEILKSLAQSRGFAPFFGFQTTEKSDGQVGMDLWILMPYKTTLAAFTKRNTMTHLGAVNLGIDLCAALALCRKAGYLYQDLKPENVFLTSQRQFQLGDLGFLSLEELTYATFPDKYRSAYTAPELFDDFAELNTTIDIYALGMVLYEIYNGGKSPFGDGPEGERRRLQGEALPAPAYADYEMAAILQKATAFKPQDRWQTPEEMGQALIAYMQRNPVNDAIIAPPIVTEPELDAAAQAIDSRTVPEAEAPAPEAKEPLENPPEDTTEIPESPPETVAEDETLPGEEDQDAGTPTKDEELEDILNRAQSFLRQPETPPENPEAESLPEPEDYSEPLLPHKKRSFKKLLAVCITLVVLAALAVGTYFFYNYYYCIPVDKLEVAEGSLDTLTVAIRSQADPAALRVSCQGTYGDTYSATLQDGKATFTGLKPDTQYTVTVSIEGFHKLTGQTTMLYTTGSVTEITSFTALTGSEDGSVIVSFTPKGTEPDSWTLEYSAPGEETKTRDFTGRTVTLTGLTVGQEYTLRLLGDNDVSLSGMDSITFTASAVVTAQNLRITDYTDSVLTVTWDEPETPVAQWEVRCSNGSTYDETVTVTGCSATLEGIDPAHSYSIRVTAQGMTVDAQIAITANPVFIQDWQVGTDESGAMTVSWTATGATPDGWVLLYAYGENPEDAATVEVTENTAVIDPVLPGATYTFQLQATDGTTVFNDSYTATAPESSSFQGFGLTVSDITMATFPAPEDTDWQVSDLNGVVQTTDFTVGSRMGFLLHAETSFNSSDDTVNVLIVLRDENGTPVRYTFDALAWHTMWTDRYFLGEVEAPQTPGGYTLEVYFDNQLVRSTLVNVTE